MELKEELPLHRLSCGCLVRCNDEGGGEWIENKKCTTDGIHHCEIDEYVAKHKVCLLCGRCLICFDHQVCYKLKNISTKVLSWLASYIIFPIYDFIDYIKYKLRRRNGNKK